MLNQNLTLRGTQTTGLGVMVGSCSPDRQHKRFNHHPVNVACFFFRYPNNELRNHTNQRQKHKTWTNNKIRLALLCFLGATLHKEVT